MLNITLNGDNSAGIMYDDELSSHYLILAYVSGIIRKCFSCFYYGTTVLGNACPASGNCYISGDETCNACNQGLLGLCKSCAVGYVLKLGKCAPICAEQVNDCY